MGVLIDEYRRNWAIRYLREAESDLSTAERTPISAMSVNLATLAMRKMQTAIYYSLGDPSYMAFLVGSAIEEGLGDKDSLMRFLVQVEWLIQVRNARAIDSEKEATLKEARRLMKLASEMIKGILGKGLEEFG